MNNRTFKEITVYIVSVDLYGRDEFLNAPLEQLKNDANVFMYSLTEFQDMINDEQYQTGDWIRIA